VKHPNSLKMALVVCLLAFIALFQHAYAAGTGGNGTKMSELPLQSYGYDDAPHPVAPLDSAPSPQDARVRNTSFTTAHAITFATNGGAGSRNNDIYTMGLDGSKPQLFISSADVHAWSPDGSKIAYLQFGSEVVVANANGSGAKDLLVSTCCELSWSPDGTRLTFPDGSNDGLDVINADGTAFKEIVGGGGGCWTGQPSCWDDVDGSTWVSNNTIVFGEGNLYGPTYAGLWQVSASGGGPARISTGGLDDSVIFPAASPDGTKIAFYAVNSHGYCCRIYTIPSGGGAATAISPDNEDDRTPAWSPDGKLILYTSYSGGNGAIEEIPSTGGTPTDLTAAESTWNNQSPQFEPSQLSIVQLGDSVAAGEGTLNGCTYDSSTQTLSCSDPRATYPGPYPLCHDSPDAYGEVVSEDVGTTFHQFACTGASFYDGISAPEKKGKIVMRPAEFGNWATKQGLNPDYDSAKPDLVLVTLGADDIKFSDIVEPCVKNALSHPLGGKGLICTSINPGPTIQKDFFAELPQLKTSYKELVSWIEARGKAAGKVPKIVITNYYDPLPPGGATCPDTWSLRPEQLTYLDLLWTQFNRLIKQTITGLNDPNVGFVDLSQAFVGHTWCTSDPWAYGLSIIHLYRFWNTYQEPFHPSPLGQVHLAELVEPVVTRLLSSSAP
jgi:Tol biopolymer transport system component/lysophospholipase L1-like esterase